MQTNFSLTLKTRTSKQVRLNVNEEAFRDLLCDLKLWLRRPPRGEEGANPDYALLAYLIDHLVAEFSWVFEAPASQGVSRHSFIRTPAFFVVVLQARTVAEKASKLVADCLFDSLIYILVDALEEVNSDNAAAVHFMELVAATMRLFTIILLANPTSWVLQL